MAASRRPEILTLLATASSPTRDPGRPSADQQGFFMDWFRNRLTWRARLWLASSRAWFKPRLCVHGLFRSGTNFFRVLMESNFDCTISYDEFGWKHAFFPIASSHSPLILPDTPSVLVTKHPLSALASLHSYASTNPRNIDSAATEGFSAFLRSAIVVFDGWNPQSAEYRFASPLEYWNAMNWNLHSVVRKRPSADHIRYEDLLEDPERALAGLVEKYQLKRRTAAFEVPRKRLNNLGEKQHHGSKVYTKADFDIDDHQKRLQAVAADDLDYISRNLCWPLVRNLGYEEICKAYTA
jgi:hypothetical protein